MLQEKNEIMNVKNPTTYYIIIIIIIIILFTWNDRKPTKICQSNWPKCRGLTPRTSEYNAGDDGILYPQLQAILAKWFSSMLIKQ